MILQRLHWLSWTALAGMVGAYGCAPAASPRPGPDAPSGAVPLKVMTFNIRYGTAADGADSWVHRRDLVFKVVADAAPHVLAVQEALRFQLDELRARFPGYGEAGVGRDDGVEAGEYSAILYDRTRLELLSSGTFWLSDTPEVPGSMSWGNRIPRVATWARLRERGANRAFYVFNTHWDHESQPARERSALLLVQRIRERPGRDPVLLTGDFNAGPENPAVRALLATGDPVVERPLLVDTYTTSGSDDEGSGTYHAFRGDRSGPRIDAVFASPEWQVLSHATVTYQRQERFPSDHFPVVAELLLRRPTANQARSQRSGSNTPDSRFLRTLSQSKQRPFMAM